MLKKSLHFSLLIAGVITILAFKSKGEPRYSNFSEKKDSNKTELTDMSVESALILIGDEKPLHYIEQADLDSARMGEELVYFGKLNDGSNREISKYFVCTDCHNQVLETADPSDESPEAVLAYSKEKNIPFLPAATFYGMYNKRHWYNGDYAHKYGDLVAPTRDTLFNAIQLCATQCSQGREMTDWEIRSIMHYYKTLEFKISDLKFDQNELDEFSRALASDYEKAREILSSKYSDINDAHFGTSKIPEIEGYEPSAENGAYIYEMGCLHCHAPGKNITNFDLDTDKLSFKFLSNKKEKYNHYSISHITRYGTYAISGRKQYMPQYSMENMSDKQMLDLLYYVDLKAEE